MNLRMRLIEPSKLIFPRLASAAQRKSKVALSLVAESQELPSSLKSASLRVWLRTVPWAVVPVALEGSCDALSAPILP